MSERPTDDDWLTLSEASRFLGVSAATVRRWSDAGRLRVFTTPGGHRRFPRGALQRLLPADRASRPHLGSVAFAPARLSRVYRRAHRETRTALPWVVTLSEEQRVLFRERGQAIARELLQHLDASDAASASHHLKEASVVAAEYGRAAAGGGLSLSQTIEAFLRFRAPFHHELAQVSRRRGFDAAETAGLLQAAERAMDRLLVATMTGHSVASAGDPDHPTLSDTSAR